MKHKEEFKDWLPDNGVKSDNSISQYFTYSNTIEEAFGDIDEFFNGVIEDAINQKFTVEKFQQNTKYNPVDIEKAVSNYKSAAKKYWDFIKDKRPVSSARIVYNDLAKPISEK